MEVKVIEQKENPLLRRKEIRFEVSFTGPTPSRKQIKELLCSKLGVDASLAVIDIVEQGYGSTAARGYAKVYESKEAMGIESKHKLDRDTGVKEKKEEKKGGGGSG
ncbi:MAG: 30S ribosomal protein S24e [Candidatus Micrarchaeia archaeon]